MTRPRRRWNGKDMMGYNGPCQQKQLQHARERQCLVHFGADCECMCITFCKSTLLKHLYPGVPSSCHRTGLPHSRRHPKCSAALDGTPSNKLQKIRKYLKSLSASITLRRRYALRGNMSRGHGATMGTLIARVCYEMQSRITRDEMLEK